MTITKAEKHRHKWEVVAVSLRETLMSLKTYKQTHGNHLRWECKKCGAVKMTWVEEKPIPPLDVKGKDMVKKGTT